MAKLGLFSRPLFHLTRRGNLLRVKSNNVVDKLSKPQHAMVCNRDPVDQMQTNYSEFN